MDELLIWSDELCIGIRVIDEQHKELINIINIANMAVRSDKKKAAIKLALQRLLEYTIFHFGAEEKYLELFAYPHLTNHKKEHNHFINAVANYQKQFMAGQTQFYQELAFFLNNWLKHHILHIDKGYVPLFKQNGME